MVNAKGSSNATRRNREPAPELVITDLEALRVVSEPLRLQMLDVMSEHLDRSWSAKELAERLETKQTKLYHHLALLDEHGFIRVAETRLVSGILEKRYRASAANFRVDRALLGGSGGHRALGEVLDAIFEKARAEILAGARAGLIDMSAADPERRRLAMWMTHARLSPKSVRRVMRQLERLAAIDAEQDPSGAEYGLVLSFYPRATPQEREERTEGEDG